MFVKKELKNMLVLSLIVAVLPAIIMTVFVNFGIGIFAYILCAAGSWKNN